MEIITVEPKNSPHYAAHGIAGVIFDEGDGFIVFAADTVDMPALMAAAEDLDAAHQCGSGDDVCRGWERVEQIIRSTGSFVRKSWQTGRYELYKINDDGSRRFACWLYDADLGLDMAEQVFDGKAIVVYPATGLEVTRGSQK